MKGKVTVKELTREEQKQIYGGETKYILVIKINENGEYVKTYKLIEV